LATLNVNVDSSTIQQVGNGVVQFAGVERVNINANGDDTIVNGTAGDDTFRVQPTASGQGNFTVSSSGAFVGTSPQFIYTGATNFMGFRGGSGGFDVLDVLGNEA